jgi:dihydropteroate synthase
LDPSARIFRRDRVTIIGVVNVTPDSFSDGGRFVGVAEEVDLSACVDVAETLVAAGAHVLDVGGESTRPGAPEVPVEAEIARTAHVVESLVKHFEVPVSIDTRKSAVAEAALASGATLVNDVAGLRFDPALAEVVARAGAHVLIGHARGTPDVMQDAPHYADVIQEVGDELAASVAVAEAAGIPRERIAVDPGIGFGKRLEDNLALLARVGELRERLGLPVCVGPSRKSMFAALMQADPADRDPATHAACAIAVYEGADAVRVHDVAGAAQAVAVGRALRGERAR